MAIWFRRFLRLFWINALLVAVVLLPCAIAAMLVGAQIRGSRAAADPSAGELFGLLTYFALFVPLVAGSVAHSLAISVLPSSWGPGRLRWATVGLAFLVPLVGMATPLSAADLVPLLVVELIVSTLVYGLVAARFAVPGHRPPAA